MKRSSYLSAVLFAALTGWLTVASCTVYGANPNQSSSPPGQARTPIKIGYISSLTGISESGPEIVKGLKLYLVETHGKMGGRPVETVIENDESSPATAVAKVRKLIKQDKVDILAGVSLAHAVYAVSPIVEAAHIPLVVAVGGADDVTQRKRGRWVIRTSWTSSQAVHPFGEYVAKHLGCKRVVAIASDFAYGYEAVGGFQKSFEQSGGQIIQKLWSPLGFVDFSYLLKQIRPDADAIFLCTVGKSTEVMPTQVKKLFPKIPIFGNATNFDDNIVPLMGAELLGDLSPSPYSMALNTPVNKKFVAAYRKMFHTDPCWFSECGYTNAMWIDAAITSLKGDVSNKEKLIAALRKVELNAPRGPMKLDDYGEVVDNIYVRKVEKVNGKFQNSVIHTFPMVSQFWKWNPQEYMKEPPYTKTYPPCPHCSR